MSSQEHWVIGIHAVSQLLKQRPADVSQLYLQAGRQDKRLQFIRDLATKSNIAVNEVERSEIDQHVGSRHQGVAARCRSGTGALTERDLDAVLSKAGKEPLLLVLDGVTDPQNLGACLRSADAAGAAAVIVPKDKSATLNATVRKVASGAAETVKLVTVTNLARCLEQLKEQGIWIVGTDDEAEESLYDRDLTGAIALVLGSEGTGLRRLTREKCDHLVAIPMAGKLSSLNVSVAAGIALFEAVRQRRK